MRRTLAAALVLLMLAGGAGSAWARPAKHAKGRGKVVVVPPLTKSGLPNVQSASAIIVDLDSGKELFARNADEVRPIASVGKLFLALAVRGKGLPLDGTTVITEEDRLLARGGARSRLQVGHAFTNHDLLRAMLIASDNRACNALGRAVGWTTRELVKAMGDRARALGLKKTRFDDPSGLNGNVSTAREVVVALKAALADPVIAAVLEQPDALVRSVGPRPIAIQYFSTNVPLRTEKRFPILGGKTGYTDEARYCLAIAAKIGGRRIGMVFLGAEGELTRFADFRRSAGWLMAGPGEVTAKR